MWLRLCRCVLYGHGQGGVATHGGNVTGIGVEGVEHRRSGSTSVFAAIKVGTHSSIPYSDATYWDITVLLLNG